VGAAVLVLLCVRALLKQADTLAFLISSRNHTQIVERSLRSQEGAITSSMYPNETTLFRMILCATCVNSASMNADKDFNAVAT
jgi:hypothetical protein